jgi:hypothetical protein
MPATERSLFEIDHLTHHPQPGWRSRTLGRSDGYAARGWSCVRSHRSSRPRLQWFMERFARQFAVFAGSESGNDIVMTVVPKIGGSTPVVR